VAMAVEIGSILAAGGGFVLFMVLGLAGWGGALLSLALPEREGRGLGLAAAAGLACYLALAVLLEGGILRSSRWITGFLAVGLVVQLLRLWGKRRHVALPSAGRGRWMVGAALGAVGLLALNSAGWHFANTDDVQGYLVYAERIFQTGSTGPDPFSYRRFEAGLGGAAWAYGLGDPLRESWRLRIVDIGGGLIMLAALLLADLRARAVPPAWAAAGLLALVFLAAFSPAMNMTPDMLGMAMVYAFARLCMGLAGAPFRPARPVLIGLFAFGLVCLKTTYLVPAAAIAGAFYGTLLWRERRVGVVGEALVAGLAALAFALPWALISLREAGTLLFPFTGAGRLSPLQGTDAASLADFI